MTQRLYINSDEFIPTQELALIKAIELKKEETSSSGIILSIRKESVVERPTAGEVISIGKIA
jgi:co-chaperonin GroES (HSP10)